MQTKWAPSKQAWLVGGVIVLSAANALFGAYAMARGIRVSESTQMLWYLVFSILVGVWLKNDIAERGSDADRQIPHYLIFLFWPLLLPYHLFRSRGVEGLVLFLGFVAMYIAPWFVEIVMWAEHAS